MRLPSLRKESGLYAPPPFSLPIFPITTPLPSPHKGFMFDVSLETVLALLYLDLQEA